MSSKQGYLSEYARQIVSVALARSLGQIPSVHVCAFDSGVCVFCHDTAAPLWKIGDAFKGKVLVFGQPDVTMFPLLGLVYDDCCVPVQNHDVCVSAENPHPYTESPAYLKYIQHPLHVGLSKGMHKRAFTRFDYTDEWNNVGFGRICTDGSPWSVAGNVTVQEAQELAGMYVRTEQGEDVYAGTYMSLYDTSSASILWCARPVGPVDSTEWSVIENFISDWRADDMPCLPVLCQSPAGYRCVVTMRLDCDEAIASARPLFELYQSENIPFSLAVKTSLDITAEDMALLEEIKVLGGSLLSHTHMHGYNWGNSYEEVLRDANMSRERFKQIFPQAVPPTVAVSPFHTNPPYAVKALENAGFTGFVSGIIHNDPEYLLGRAGVVPFAEKGIVSISQQSMLHGDCYTRQQESVAVHIAAFEAQYVARGIFGYLDHPFSERYQYDWTTEEQRVHAHKQLIDAMKLHEGVCFWTEEQCFDFVQALSQVCFEIEENGVVKAINPSLRTDIVYKYKDTFFTL